MGDAASCVAGTLGWVRSLLWVHSDISELRAPSCDGVARLTVVGASLGYLGPSATSAEVVNGVRLLLRGLVPFRLNAERMSEISSLSMSIT